MSGCNWCEDGAGAALIERARVVGVLDVWAGLGNFWLIRRHSAAGDEWQCWCNNKLTSWGPTPDAARAAAAKAIEEGSI